MTVVDEARASLERLIVDRQAVVDDRDSVQADLDSALSAGFALRAQLDRLQAEFDAYKAAHPDTDPPPPDPPPPTTILIGATVGANDGGLSVTADIRRCYDLSGSGAQDASRRAKVGGIVWANYKMKDYGGRPPTDAELRAGLQALSNIVRAKGQTGRVTAEHEPSIKDVIPPTVYRGLYEQLERIIPEFPLLEPCVCMAGFDGDKNPTLWETYWRPSHRVIGFDHYNKGHQTNGEPFATPAENYGKLAAWAKSKGKPAVIGETGVGPDAVPGPTIKTRPDWYAAHRDYVLDPANNIVAACAYDARDALLDAASARAWYGV